MQYIFSKVFWRGWCGGPAYLYALVQKVIRDNPPQKQRVIMILIFLLFYFWKCLNLKWGSFCMFTHILLQTQTSHCWTNASDITTVFRLLNTSAISTFHCSESLLCIQLLSERHTLHAMKATAAFAVKWSAYNYLFYMNEHVGAQMPSPFLNDLSR